MTKKNVGLAKEEVVRVHKSDRQDLNFIKGLLKMGDNHNEGDVIHELISMYKSAQIGTTPFLVKKPSVIQAKNLELQTKIDEYQSLYEGTIQTNKTLVKATKYLCEKHQEDYAEIMEIVKN